jgi:hypothetical protein
MAAPHHQGGHAAAGRPSTQNRNLHFAANPPNSA